MKTMNQFFPGILLLGLMILSGCQKEGESGEDGEAKTGGGSGLIHSRTADGSGDAVRICIPVKSAYIERTEHRGGALSDTDFLSPDMVLEGVSSSSSAECDLFVSGTRWMPKLVGMAGKDRPAATVADLSGAALSSLLVASMDGYLPSSMSQ
jgi:hypothetical protein|tara:strand:- start:4859 stop:5314 length:456 start_codon:yes stop_codon:yes gene_type:complete